MNSTDGLCQGSLGVFVRDIFINWTPAVDRIGWVGGPHSAHGPPVDNHWFVSFK